MTSELSSEDLACLNECRAVAMENSRFYARAYDANINENHRALIGSAAAQRKVFVEAMSAILAGSDGTPAKPSPNRPQGLILELPNTLSPVNSAEFKALAKKHEQQFITALKEGLDFIENETTREVLQHHLLAAKIATKALLDADLVE